MSESESPKIKPLKKTEKLEILKKQLEELENESDESEVEEPVILEKPKKEKPVKVDKRKTKVGSFLISNIKILKCLKFLI